MTRPGGNPRPLVRLVAILMGLPCGMLIFILVDILRANPRWEDAPSTLTRLLVLAIGWCVSAWLLALRADGVPAVLQRGFLFGAAAWLVIGMLIPILGRIAAPESPSGSLADHASWERPAPDLTQGVAAVAPMRSVAIALAVLCLAAWSVTFVASGMLRRRADRRANS